MRRAVREMHVSVGHCVCDKIDGRQRKTVNEMKRIHQASCWASRSGQHFQQSSRPAAGVLHRRHPVAAGAASAQPWGAVLALTHRSRPRVKFVMSTYL